MRELFSNLLSDPVVALWIKLAAPSITIVSGVVGLGRKARDDNGKITWIGRVAVVGILAGGLFSTLSILHDYRSANNDTQKSIQQNQDLLASVQRGRLSAHDLHLQFSISLLDSFRSFDRYIKTLSTLPRNGYQCGKNRYHLTCVDFGGNATYRIPFASPAFPRTGTEARAVLDAIAISITFTKFTRASREYPYERIGSLVVGRNSASWVPVLLYTPHKHSLTFEVDDVAVRDIDLAASNLHSLVDIHPGIVTSRAIFKFDLICQAISTKGNCDSSVRIPISQGTHLVGIRLRFPGDEMVLSNATALNLSCGNGPPFLLLRTHGLNVLSNRQINDYVTADADADADERKTLCELVDSFGDTGL
jgi:hypothetical protein